mmetsp:Transcript_7968/g.32904  ORF Transcript_7968/g.32904 Transcript_7968/m.32904 type:complete len:265 (+) Transcript_7968:1766-2560(+)
MALSSDADGTKNLVVSAALVCATTVGGAVLLVRLLRTTRRDDSDVPAIFAGSFNPPHRGHVAILRHLATRHRRVYAVVATNARKRYAVSATERAALVQRAVDAEHESRGTITAVAHEGFVWRLALRLGPPPAVLYRGVRSWRSDGPAECVLLVQNWLGPLVYLGCLRAGVSSSGAAAPEVVVRHRRRGLRWWWRQWIAPRPVHTRFLRSEAGLEDLSSSAVRARLRGLGDLTSSSEKPQTTAAIADLVPEAIAADVARLWGSSS